MFTPPRLGTRREEMIPVLRTRTTNKFNVTWDFMTTGSWDFMHFCTEFWQFFMATGKHATSWKFGRLDSLVLAISPQMPNATLEMNIDIVKALAASVLVIYDDAVYKLDISEEGRARWGIIETDNISCKSEENELSVELTRGEHINTRPFIIRQSDNSFCSTGFDLLKRTPDCLDGKWIYKSCRRVFEEIEE